MLSRKQTQQLGHRYGRYSTKFDGVSILLELIVLILINILLQSKNHNKKNSLFRYLIQLLQFI